ncbi:MAG: ATP-binding protein, partial [Acidimicrobiia bacterium]
LFEAASVLDALVAGDVERAGEIATGSSAVAFSELVDYIASLRGELASAIAAAAAESGTVATASRFMVAFFVPSIAVAVAFLVARRRRKRELLAIELEQERALNRSKDQLIANISHELRTPLTGIYTSALAIEEVGTSDPELSQELTGIIIDQSTDLTRMVEDLLISAQADAGRLRFDLRPTDIEKLTSDLEKEFVRFDTQIDFDLEPGFVLADPGRLRQLLRNLVSNGAKYGQGRVAVKGQFADSTYVVEVIDNGPGVSPDVEQRMFERFVHRGDQPLLVGSVGLGLAISKVLAEGMSGRIAYRRSDEETIFEVTLERAIGPDAQMPPDPAPHEAPTAIDPDAQMPPDPAPHEASTVGGRDAQMPADPWA